MEYDVEDISNKSQIVTFVLLLLFGSFGAHRFYVGKYITGLIYCILGVGSWALSLLNIGYTLIAQIIFLLLIVIDLYALYSDSFTDGKGKPVVGKDNIMVYETDEERDQKLFIAKLDKLMMVLIIFAVYIVVFILRNFVL